MSEEANDATSDLADPGYRNENKRKMRRVKGNALRIKAVTIKYLKISARDKPMYFWVFGYPLLFMVFMIIAFGGSGPASQFKIAIINQDNTPLASQTNAGVVDAAGNYLEDLFKYNESGLDEVFSLVEIDDLADGLNRMKKEEVDAIVIIPANFSEVALGFIDGNPKLDIYTTPDPVKKGVIPSVLDSIVSDFVMKYNGIEEVQVTPIETVARSYSGFDYFVPGIVIAGVTIAIMNVAQLFCNDKANGQMERLDTTPVPRSVQLFGSALAQIIFTSIQVLILMVLLPIFGVSVDPNANWGLAFLNAFIFGWACIGIGLILAAVVKDANAAGGIAWVFILPLQFLGGLMASFGDQPFQRVFPSYYAGRAMRNILIAGLGFADVWLDILVNFVFGVVFMVIGLIIFQKKTQV